MSIPPGTRLGAYSVTAQIGAGGMGEVYKATDTNLKRAVALKVLPVSLANDAERLARFQREAEVLGSLNHPNIAQVYGFEKGSGLSALVMELVEGDDLSQRIARGAMPLDEVIPIAKQIAEALEAAHTQGIIHRDLKPANIKVRPDGTVKVLDFGLAKALEQGSGIGDQGSPNIANSPTITTPAMTQAGMILGTAAYMSPEQAKGRALDKRSDIWSFGCVLFEMLTGQRAFAGEDVTDTLAAIIRADPDWALLPKNLPRSVRAIVEGCLQKDRAKRLADIAVVLFLLNEPRAATTPVPPAAVSSSRVWRIAAATLALTTLSAAGAAAYWYRERPAAAVTQFLIAPPDKSVFVTAGRTGTSAVISPDGHRLAYTLRDEAGKILIWTRSLDALSAQPLPGTDEAEFPFWSPDSRSLGYFSRGKLMRIDASGGPAQTLCDAAGARGGTWSSQGDIVFGGGTGNGLTRVSMSGGDTTAITKAAGGDHRFPSFLPDGRHLLFFWQSPGTDTAGLYVVSLDAPAPRKLAASESGGVYDRSGVILFARQTTLLAQPFNLSTLSLSGDPRPVAEHLESGVFGGIISFSVADSGTLAYGVGTGRDTALQLTWYDRQGKALSPVGQPGNYMGVELSPDDKRLAVHTHVSGTGGDLWLIDMARGTTSRLTFDAGQDNSSPVWSPDGTRMAFASLRNGLFGLYIKPSNGTGAETRIEIGNSPVAPASWSPDGKFLVYNVNPRPNSPAADIWMVPVDGPHTPVPLLTTPFIELAPQISPDGKWLAYTSDETGINEVYVRPFPSGEGKWQVSNGGGSEPRWRGDSKELFYFDRPQLGSVTTAEVSATGPMLSVGSARKLFTASILGAAHPGAAQVMRFAVSRDGQRILLPVNPRTTTFSDSTSSPLAVVMNWTSTLKH